VNVSVATPASQAQLSFPFSALGNSGDVTIEIRGTRGATTMTFASNASCGAIAEAIAAVADSTGISATISTTATAGFMLYSREYGSREFVQVRVLTSGQNFFSVTPSGPTRDYGADAVATINGSLASADGNHLALKNSSIDVELDVQAGFASNTAFSVTGGGALFQVGPQVNTNMQVNLAINSVHASELGNAVAGYLSQMKTGGEYDLASEEYTHASDIINESVDQISVLRGRLGSFERNTLDTNMNQLGITVENLMSAESAIRDADFAYETSRLARAQILVNAGTTVLTLANQTTQSVLRLLGG
jgi:flagellin